MSMTTPPSRRGALLLVALGLALASCDDKAAKRSAAPAAAAQEKPAGPAASFAQRAAAAKTAAEELPLREQAYAVAPSADTLVPLVDVLTRLGRVDEANKRAALERERSLAELLQPFAVDRVKQLRLLPSAEGAVGRLWSQPSGTCPVTEAQCPLVVFGKTALSPLTMTCSEPSPVTGSQLLEKAEALKGWERQLAERADRDNQGLKPLNVDSVTTVDLNGDKRPDRLFTVSLRVEGGAARSCLLGEVNGRYALLEGSLCLEEGTMAPVQAFKVNQVPGMFMRVLREGPAGRGAILVHYVKGSLREVLADCTVGG